MNKRSEIKLSSFFRICGREAKYSYFGAIVCQPCKMFFRRNGQKGLTHFVCCFENQCQINTKNRRNCNLCRLKKCFQSGMCVEKFRASIMRRAKRSNSMLTETNVFISIQDKKQRDFCSSSTFVEVERIQFNRTEDVLLSIGQRFIETYRTKQMTRTMNEKLIQEFLSSIYHTTGIYLRTNDDLCHLSFEHRSIVLQNAANHLACMIGGFVMHQYDLLNFNEFFQALKTIYGQRSVDMTISSMKFIDSDILLMKLVVPLFAFCTTISSTDSFDSIEMFNIQNKYVDAVWKYLLYQYGDREAMKRFLKLTRWMTSIMFLVSHLQFIERHVTDANSLVEQIEITLILDDADRIMEQ